MLIPEALQAEFDALAMQVASLAMRAEAGHYIPFPQFMAEFAAKVDANETVGV